MILPLATLSLGLLLGAALVAYLKRHDFASGYETAHKVLARQRREERVREELRRREVSRLMEQEQAR